MDGPNLSRLLRAVVLGSASAVLGTLGHLEANSAGAELHLSPTALAAVAAFSALMAWVQSRRSAGFVLDTFSLLSNQFVIHVGLVIAMIRWPGAFHTPGPGHSELAPWEVLLPNPQMSGAHLVATLLTAASLAMLTRCCTRLRQLLSRIASLADLAPSWRLPGTQKCAAITFDLPVRRSRIVGVAPGRGPPAYAC